MAKSKKQKKDPDIIMEYDFDEEKKKAKVDCPEVTIEQAREKIEEEEKRCPKEKVSEEGLTAEERRLKRKGKSKKRREKEKELKKDIEAPIDSTIQALLDSEKTFVENITRKSKKSLFSAFYPFPKNVSFLSIGSKEVVVLVVRHHWVGLVPKALLALVVFLFPFLIAFSVPTLFEGAISSALFSLGMFIFFMMMSVSILVDSFFKWFFEMNVLTTQRIVDVNFVSVNNHRVSETTYDQVQDVTHSPHGVFASSFDYGHLYVQTAGSKNEFEFKNIPRPRDVQDAILDLRELRRKNIAQGK